MKPFPEMNTERDLAKGDHEIRITDLRNLPRIGITVNGKEHKLPVNEPVTVDRDILHAIHNSGIEFEFVGTPRLTKAGKAKVSGPKKSKKGN